MHSRAGGKALGRSQGNSADHCWITDTQPHVASTLRVSPLVNTQPAPRISQHVLLAQLGTEMCTLLSTWRLQKTSLTGAQTQKDVKASSNIDISAVSVHASSNIQTSPALGISSACPERVERDVPWRVTAWHPARRNARLTA